MMQIEVDHRRLSRKLQQLEQGLTSRQVASVINSSIQSTRGYASRLARSVLNLKAKQIYASSSRNTNGDRILMYKSDSQKLSASLYFTEARPNIEEFGARAAPKGASVTTWKGLGRQQYPSAWQKKRNPKRWYRRKGQSRFPYEGIRGPSMAEAMEPAKGQVIEFASRRMEIEYQRRLRGILSRG